jgi:hypothetical protein
MSKIDKLNKPMREHRKGVDFTHNDKYIYAICRGGLTFVTNVTVKFSAS